MIVTRRIRRRMGGISVLLARVSRLGFNGRREGIYWSRLVFSGWVNGVILGRRLGCVSGILLENLRWLDRN